jgi:hypothetical protein
LATRTVLGEPIGEFYGYKVSGIFQTAAEVAASKQKGAARAILFTRILTKMVLLTPATVWCLAARSPKYNYGINTSFTYKNFDLALDFQGVADVSVYNANIAYRFGNENFTKDFYDHRWHGPGTSNTYPSVNVGKNQCCSKFVLCRKRCLFQDEERAIGLYPTVCTAQKMGPFQNPLVCQRAKRDQLFGYKGFSPEIGGTPA